MLRERPPTGERRDLIGKPDLRALDLASLGLLPEHYSWSSLRHQLKNPSSVAALELKVGAWRLRRWCARPASDALIADLAAPAPLADAITP